MSERFDARIATQMQEVVVLLEDHDLEPAEARINSLLLQVNLTSPESIREKKLVNLRQRLSSGIRHIQRLAPITAKVEFYQALLAWLRPS